MNTSTTSTLCKRRTFIQRLVQAGFAALSAGAVGLYFRDSKGPAAHQGQPQVQLPDFRLADKKPAVAVVHGDQRRQTLRRALSALGGINTFIGHGDRVLLKVNAAFASPPMLNATSHPDLVSEMVAMCLQAGAASVTVSDNPINDPASCFALTGIARAAKSAGARIVVPGESDFRPTTVSGGRLIKNWPVLWRPFEGVTKVIGLAPVKDHHRSGASMTLKNWYGLLGGGRNVFHQDIHRIIMELALMVKPTLVVLDGTDTMIANGPTGGSLADLKATRTLIAGTDPVAVDTLGARLLDKGPGELPYLMMAQAAGVGTVDLSAVKLYEDAL